MQIEVPRDRDGSFEPVIVKKRQRRLDGIDQIVLSLSARGLTTGEISAHFGEVYGASVGKDTISRITNSVLDAMSEWQNRRPVEPAPTQTTAGEPSNPGCTITVEVQARCKHDQNARQ